MERLLHMLTNPEKRRVWILNRKYCPNQKMVEGQAAVVYSYQPVQGETPFSFEAISNIQDYNYKTFLQAYRDERRDILDHDAQERRISAIWSFYRNVRKDDVMLFVHGSIIEGYYVVTAEEVSCQNLEDCCIHSWAAETIRFARPVFISGVFGSPYFKIIGNFRKAVIEALRVELAV